MLNFFPVDVKKLVLTHKLSDHAYKEREAHVLSEAERVEDLYLMVCYKVLKKIRTTYSNIRINSVFILVKAEVFFNTFPCIHSAQ